VTAEDDALYRSTDPAYGQDGAPVEGVVFSSPGFFFLAQGAVE